MMDSNKPRVAIFEFTCCAGCQQQVINCEEELLDLLGLVDIVNFREAMSEASDDYDIAFIEGSISREGEIDRLKRIREKAKLVIALGSCSSIGGINCIKNFQGMDNVKRVVYGDCAKYYDTIEARPIDSVVKVDYYIPGCPIDKNEFLRVVKSLLIGKKPEIPNYPVCVECKLAGNVCLFEKGIFCMGPVTRAGCSAVCPSNGNSCEGCRGMVDDPNINSEKDVLQKYGLTVNEITGKFRIFLGCNKEIAKENE